MTLPTLLISYTADNCVFPSDFAEIVEAVGSTDKQVQTLEADHYGNPTDADADARRDRAAGLIDAWIAGLA